MSLDTIKHYPVMLEEVTRYLCDNKNIIDCTFGGGGYSSKILEKFPKSLVTAIDRDKNIIRFADNIKKKYPKRFNFKNLKFSEIGKIRNFKEADFFIFDLGVSHFQLKDLKRGFAFNSNEKINMGMGHNNYDAHSLINKLSEQDLKNILKLFGQEKFASKIANKVVNYRIKKNIDSPKELSEIINSIKYKKNKSNPSTKTFQALRMIVNKELSEIFEALRIIIENCKLNATILIITFNSLEDILVKKIINFYGKKKSLSRYVPEKFSQNNLSLKILTKKPIVPSKNEIKINVSSRSAKLRVVKKTMNPVNSLKRKDLNMENFFSLEDINV